MNRRVRKRMEMAGSVRTFCRAHPTDDTSFTLVLDRLDGTITRMEAVSGQQVDGFLSKHSSTVRRKDVRRRIHHGLLPHLVTVGQDAASEKLALQDMFVLPPTNTTNKFFGTVARKLLEYGQTEKDLLVKHGLLGNLLDDLKAALDEFDASVTETSDGLHDHVLASAELDALSDELMLLVGMLDGINRYRFEREPELLIAWESAKHVKAGPQSESTENPAPPSGPAQAGPGEVKPAA
jgi:hypothetical protein